MWMTKTYTLKYDSQDVAYQLDAYIQKILDGDEAKPSIHTFCAKRLNMRVDELIAVSQNDQVIGDLLNTLVAHVEAYITEAMLDGTIDRQAAQALLRQPVFSWRDRSIEAITVDNRVTYDEETRAAILASNDPDMISRIARGLKV
jgi:hypothetical protein